MKDSIFEVSKIQRNLAGQFLDHYSLEQLNTIPDGYRNNLIWNIAHMVVTQQLLVYKFSGLPMQVSDELIERYKKGTEVTAPATADEVAEIKALLVSTIAQTENDYDSGLFVDYVEYPTSTGMVLRNCDDALSFNVFHEGMHIGIMMRLKKLV
ncbi:DinB family protein [Flavobacterium algicola]|uniref:DinB family protein n=1 Tax=Flavobacterium algicola TaxID=556529 RepID=UPI001EFE9DEC|nr:DinB family protein [Flavobacterium algicola]MCG9792049.1 DinB family protein [Flavobacterium algicola]